MTWDPSIALQGAPAGGILPNPLEFFSGLQQLQARQHQNLKFQQENDARVAVGDAYAKALRSDGSLDGAKLMDMLRTNPAAQYAIPEVQAAEQKREQERIANERAKLELGTQRINMFANAIGGLLVKGDSVDISDVHKTVSKLAVQIGDPELAKTMFLGMGDFPKNGKALKDKLLEQQAAIMPVVERLNATNGPAIPVDVGGRVDMVQTNRLAGTSSTTGSIIKTATPGERAALVPAKDPETGAPLPVTRQDVGNIPRGDGTIEPRSADAPPPPGALGPTLAKEQEIIKTGEDFWKYRDDLDRRLSSGEVSLQKMQQMLQLADITRIGPLAQQRLKVAELAEGLNLPTSIVKKIAGSDPDMQASGIAAAQQFAKEAFSTAYESMKLMAPPGTQLTEGIALTNFENSIRLNMDKDAAVGLVNNARKIFRYIQEEREFMRKWEGAPKDARAAWTDKAIKDGLVKADNQPLPGSASFSGPGAKPFDRGEGVPGAAMYSDKEIREAIPDGKLGRLPLPSGGSVLVRRKGNSLVKEGQE